MLVLYTWHGHRDHNLLNISFETFSYNFTTLAMQPCFAWLNVSEKTDLLLNVWNLKWTLLPFIHHMRDYFVTMLCTCLKNIFNYIHVNINLDYFVGIPMGKICAKLIANLISLYCYERDFMSNLQKSKRFDLIDKFNYTSQNLYEIFTIDNPEFAKHIGFPIVNFPWLSGDVPGLPSYGINISQLVWFARCCSSVFDFHYKNLQITS